MKMKMRKHDNMTIENQMNKNNMLYRISDSCHFFDSRIK